MININIKSKNFSMTPEIEEYITNKISSVEKFLQMSPEENVLIEFEIEQSKLFGKSIHQHEFKLKT